MLCNLFSKINNFLENEIKTISSDDINHYYLI